MNKLDHKHKIYIIEHAKGDEYIYKMNGKYIDTHQKKKHPRAKIIMKYQ